MKEFFQEAVGAGDRSRNLRFREPGAVPAATRQALAFELRKRMR
ncbi:hypothetical protein BRO54_2221 [Geobacillus proteiniphilus]|uniref:Uncharacterized protein n=1 Tax=Geobacillus proteiniphilus TaxID=860353 RepID=A0A1Q5SY35_9BACL|nr:hypothetical protein BRO54_2221 [Geobacillus proteiniphilus]